MSCLSWEWGMRIFYRRLNRCRKMAWCPEDHTSRHGILKTVKEFTYWSQFIFFKKAVEFWESMIFVLRAFGGIRDLQVGACPSHRQCHKATPGSRVSPLHLEIWEVAAAHVSFLFSVTDSRIKSQKETFRSRIREDSDLISCKTNPREIY